MLVRLSDLLGSEALSLLAVWLISDAGTLFDSVVDELAGGHLVGWIICDKENCPFDLSCPSASSHM